MQVPPFLLSSNSSSRAETFRPVPDNLGSLVWVCYLILNKLEETRRRKLRSHAPLWPSGQKKSIKIIDPKHANNQPMWLWHHCKLTWYWFQSAINHQVNYAVEKLQQIAIELMIHPRTWRKAYNLYMDHNWPACTILDHGMESQVISKEYYRSSDKWNTVELCAPSKNKDSRKGIKPLIMNQDWALRSIPEARSHLINWPHLK